MNTNFHLILFSSKVINWTETDSLPPLLTYFSWVQSGRLGDSAAVELLFLKKAPSFHLAALRTWPAVWGCKGGFSFLTGRSDALHHAQSFSQSAIEIPTRESQENHF